jgi:hypothetical protein
LSTTLKEYQALYRAGIAAARAKDIERARKLFLAAVTLDDGQKIGWLALARLETDLDKKAVYYHRVLQIDPRDPIARAFMDGMRHTRPQLWYRSRWSMLGLLVLLFGGILALLLTQSGRTANNMLPTTARLPSITPSAALELAAPLSESNNDLAVSSATATPSPDIPVQITSFALELSTIEPTATLPPTTMPQVFPTAIPVQPMPTTMFNPPVPTVPTAFPPVIVTVAPSATRATAPSSTSQPLFMDITELPPTSLPVFATPTLDYQGDFNTEVPPPDQQFPEDPNSGGISQP